MELPPEMAEKILLETPLENLPSLCHTSRLYYDTCLSPSFWKRKLDLPFSIESLVDTTNFTLKDWLQLVNRIEKSLFSARNIIHVLLGSPVTLVIFIKGKPKEEKALNSPGIDYAYYQLLLPDIRRNAEEQKFITKRARMYWNLFRKTKNPKYEEKHQIFLRLVGEIDFELPIFRLSYDGKNFIYSFNPDETFPLTEEEAWELAFRISFFGVKYRWEID